MPKISVRQAPLDEAVKVNSTISEFGRPYSKKYFQERIEGKKNLVILAFFGKQPAGYIVGYDRFNDGSFYCWMAGVNPKFRRKGILKALMGYQERWAKKNGYNKIRIKTRNCRREMLAYLVKYGFHFTEVIQKPKIKDSRIVLEKKI